MPGVKLEVLPQLPGDYTLQQFLEANVMADGKQVYLYREFPPKGDVVTGFSAWPHAGVLMQVVPDSASKRVWAWHAAAQAALPSFRLHTDSTCVERCAGGGWHYELLLHYADAYLLHAQQLESVGVFAQSAPQDCDTRQMVRDAAAMYSKVVELVGQHHLPVSFHSKAGMLFLVLSQWEPGRCTYCQKALNSLAVVPQQQLNSVQQAAVRQCQLCQQTAWLVDPTSGNAGDITQATGLRQRPIEDPTSTSATADHARKQSRQDEL